MRRTRLPVGLPDCERFELERDIVLSRDLCPFHAAHHRPFSAQLAARGQEADRTGCHLEGRAHGTILFVPDARSTGIFIRRQASSIRTLEPFFKYWLQISACLPQVVTR